MTRQSLSPAEKRQAVMARLNQIAERAAQAEAVEDSGEGVLVQVAPKPPAADQARIDKWIL